MPKRFEPNRRLLRILVGSNLYGSPDACIRELVQNSWDAIQLRKSDGDGQGSIIELHYSVRDRWVEVIDDGLGMDLDVIEKSFLEIGQDKLDVLQRGTRETQIGYFGIGVLSIFLVADRFEVATRTLDSESAGIRFEVTGIDDEIRFLDSGPLHVGTRIKVYPRQGALFDIESIPEYLSNYARHVSGITIVSADEGTHTPLPERWVTDKSDSVVEGAHFPGVLSCRFAMNPALRADEGTLSSEVTICNAGFLAEERAHDLLPLPTIGMVGEIDLAPNALTMGMSRERIQRDDQWTALGLKLQEIFVQFALRELSGGRMRAEDGLDTPETRRNILLWYHYIPHSEPFSVLYSEIEERVFETVPFKIADGRNTTLQQIVSDDDASGRLFYRELGRSRRTTEHIDDEGLPIRITQEIRDSIRVGALRANGYDVIELGVIQVNVLTQSSVQTVQISEANLVNKCLNRRGASLHNITEASDSDMDLRSIERLPILNDALSVGAGLRFASIPDSKRRVITDSTGVRYINLRNDHVRELLEIIPRAISNPLRSRLLDAYLKLENYQFPAAREVIRDLLTSDDLAGLAGANTAPFTERHIASIIQDLLSELSE